MRLPFSETLISQRYGENVGDYLRFGLKYGHNGIDFAVPVGTPIKSVLPGVVERVKMDPGGYGLYIYVKSIGGISCLYGHLSEARVSPGTVVDDGTLLGLSGNTGNSTGAHLHYETRKIGEESNGMFGAVDPYTLVDFNVPEEIPSGSGRVKVSRLNIRKAPALNGAVVGSLSYGMLADVIGDPEERDGVVWVRLWVAKSQGGTDYLEGGTD